MNRNELKLHSQNSKAVSYMEISLSDSWDQTKQDKQINFLRHPVALSGKIAPLEFFSETICHHVKGTCSTWN